MRFSMGKLLEHISRWGTMGTEKQQASYTTYPWPEILVSPGDRVTISLEVGEEEERQCWVAVAVEDWPGRWRDKDYRVRWELEE